jgi:hypothetical protein
MILGNAGTAPDVAYFIILMGQSNADGRREPTRLQNTQYNYKGIGAGYPSVRTTQAQYVASPSNVFIYYKSVASSDDMSVDVATWQAYTAGVNSSHDDNSFGTELSCATRINDLTGKPVYIVKVAYGGTSLNTDTPSASQLAPGNWNPTNRYIAMEFYLRRAMRDFRTANPTVRPVLLAINWWQGENDAINGVGTATYESEFAALKTYIDARVRGEFVIDVGSEPVWNITRLHFNLDAAEGLINTALDNIAAAYTDVEIIDAAPYPRGVDLTTAEAAPLPVGLPNADGGLDNNHTAYIGLLGIGEKQVDNIVTKGLI